MRELLHNVGLITAKSIITSIKSNYGAYLYKKRRLELLEHAPMEYHWSQSLSGK